MYLNKILYFLAYNTYFRGDDDDDALSAPVVSAGTNKLIRYQLDVMHSNIMYIYI